MRTVLLLSLFLVLPVARLWANPLAAGSPAPILKAVDQAGDTVDFAKIYAKGITLVYFYPKAGSPGCTAEACSLRDAYLDLHAKGLQIIGVSRDSVANQSQFQESYKLPFTLVSDTDGHVAAAFGVRKMMGFIPFDQRQSFLVKNGKIVWNTPNAATTNSAMEVEKAVAQLQ